MPYLGAALTFVVGLYKDTILSKIGIKKSKAEAESVHISNSEQLMEMYNKAVNDLTKWNEINLERIEARHQQELTEIKERYQKNIDEIKALHAKQLTEIKGKKDGAIEKLRKKQNELEKQIDLLKRQLNFYQINSGLELPKDLQ